MAGTKVNRMSSLNSLRKSFRKSALSPMSSPAEWSVLPVTIDGKKAALRWSKEEFQVNGECVEL